MHVLKISTILQDFYEDIKRLMYYVPFQRAGRFEKSIDINFIVRLKHSISSA